MTPTAARDVGSDLAEHVPTLPFVALQLLQAVLDEGVDAARVIAIVKKDPAVTMKVLQVANSPVYGFRGDVSTVDRAATLLGNRAIRLIALSVSFLQTFDEQLQPSVAFDPREFWKHSLGCAAVAEELAVQTGHESPGAMFVGGLLHDVGRLALHLTDPELYGRTIEESDRLASGLLDQEQLHFGADHTIYGSRLSDRWGLPRSLTEVIRRHHEPLPGASPDNGPPDDADLVGLADTLVHRQWVGSQGYWVPVTLQREVWEQFGLQPEAEADLSRRLSTSLTELAPVFDASLDVDSLHVESLFKANQTLSHLALEVESRGRLLEHELERASLAESLHTGFRPSLDATETLKSAVRTFHDSLDCERVAGMYWEQNSSLAKLVVSQKSSDSLLNGEVPMVPRSDSTSQDMALRVATILRGSDPAVTTASTEEQIAEGRVKILSIDGIQSLEGAIIIEFAERKPAREYWTEEPMETFVGRLSMALERAVLHESVQRRNEELARARELTENFHVQMRNAERLAAVGGMAAGVAHEVNNPLSIVSSQAQLLLMDESAPDRIDKLKSIVEHSHRISKSLVELMGFARPHHASIRKIDLTALLERILELFKHRFQERDIECEQVYSPDLPLIEADADTLQQIFLNVIINADHALDKPGSLTVRAMPEEDGEHVRIEFEDTGRGIPEEDLDSVFEPFYTTKEKGKGTGLGLFICRNIVESMSGTIEAHSASGKGACFAITLPV